MYTQSVSLALLTASGLIAQSLVTQVSPAELAQFKLREPQRVSIASQYLASQKTQWLLPADAAFTAGRTSLDAAGRLHVRFEQTYKGVRITPAKIIVHMDRDDHVVDITGGIVPINIDTTPKIGQKEALDIIKSDYTRAEMRGSADLVIYVARYEDGRDAGGVRSANLAWRARVEADEETAMFYYVDAHAGTILRKATAEVSHDYTPNTGLGHTARYGAGTHFADSWDSDPPNPYAAGFYLLDPTRGNNHVINMEQKAGWDGHPYLYTHNDQWGNGTHFLYKTMDTWGPEGRGTGFEAAIAMQRLWDLLKNVFDRDGLDGNGKGMIARVHARKKTSEPYGDARWDGTHGNFGDANGYSRTDINTVGHEFGHALFQTVLGTNDFSGEGKGLNEGQGDIAGMLTKAYHTANGGTGSVLPVVPDLNWYEDRMVDPYNYTNGSGHGLSYYQVGMGSQEEHDQGCAYGHAFVFLSYGASAIPGTPRYSTYLPGGMVGIGLDKAARIWYKALVDYLDDSPTFQEVRAAYINAALDLYGDNSIEVKAVQNAFWGINVTGGPNPYSGATADTQTPNANLSNPIVNEDEATVFVGMSATDDMGVAKLELTLDGVSVAKVEGPGPKSWYGYVSIAGLGNASHTLRATATDAAGKTNQESKQFILVGRNRLIDNGTFENGAADWAASSNNNYGWNSAYAFLGSGYVQFPGAGAWIKQTVSVPATATSVKLYYRLRVEKFFNPIMETMVVDVLNQGGTVLETLAAYTSETPLGSGVENGFALKQHVNLAGYAGQTIQIRFRTVAALFGRFKLDHVNLNWSGPVSATTHAAHDDDEGSVEIEVTDITNIGQEQVKNVSLIINGGGVGGWAAPGPYKVAYPMNAFTPDVQHTASAQVRNMANTVVATTPDVHFTIHPGNNVLDNPGFESGTFPWSRTGGSEIGINNGEAQLIYAFLGNRFAYMASNGAATQILQQQVYLPGDADNITLGFRLRIDSAAHDASDYVQVRLLDADNNVLGTLATYHGDFDTHSPANWMGYQKVKINITSYKGQIVRLQFRATHSASHPTTFYVDNVSVVASASWGTSSVTA